MHVTYTVIDQRQSHGGTEYLVIITTETGNEIVRQSAWLSADDMMVIAA